MTKEPIDYYTLVVRAWKIKSTHSDQGTWRFVLVMPTSETRHGFSNPEALCSALYAMLTEITESEQTQEE